MHVTRVYMMICVNVNVNGVIVSVNVNVNVNTLVAYRTEAVRKTFLSTCNSFVHHRDPRVDQASPDTARRSR